jgi:hypothetical protein
LPNGIERIDRFRLRVFTCNDTVAIVYFPARSSIGRDDLGRFTIRLRSLMMHSLRDGILFRGAIAADHVYVVEDDTNTVMGPAVTDAASWYVSLGILKHSLSIIRFC